MIIDLYLIRSNMNVNDEKEDSNKKMIFIKIIYAGSFIC